MRIEKDSLGEKHLPKDARYGIHALRAKENFPDRTPFHLEWYKAIGLVKLACYNTVESFIKAATKEYANILNKLNLPSENTLTELKNAANKIASGEDFEHFIIPAIQGGAGTSINMNINEIICNNALISIDKNPGEYQFIDPIEDANIFQSTNDVIPTALKMATMQLLNKLEKQINELRQSIEEKEKTYRNVPRMGYTQMQYAVPSSYGLLFAGYNDALSRDWWRISKGFERIKTVNLGGGAIGTGIAIPRFYIMEVTQELKRLSGLPLTQSENMTETTSNQDTFVEVHAILKAHAVNLEKMANDLRLLAADISNEHMSIPEQQAGSSIMPGKINPVIPEFIVSSAHKIYANDQIISSLSAMGVLELNAYLPSIGHALLESLKLLIAMNKTLHEKLFKDLTINTSNATTSFYEIPAICTALIPLIGYHKAGALSKHMKQQNCDVFEANNKFNYLSNDKIKELMQPSNLLKKGFSLKDI